MACRSYSLYHYELTLLSANAIINICTLLSLTIFQYNFIKTSSQLVGHNLLTSNFYITSLSIFVIDVFTFVSANDVHLISGSQIWISIDSYSFPACKSHISSLTTLASLQLLEPSAPQSSLESSVSGPKLLSQNAFVSLQRWLLVFQVRKL